MGVTSPGRRGVECGRPRPPESQQIWFRWERGISNGWEDRRANLSIRRGEKKGGRWEPSFPPQRIGYPRSRGVPRGGAGRRREAFGHKSILLWLWEIGRFSLRQMSCFRGVNASPDGEIPPKVRQMARDQAFEIPRRLTVRRSGERRAWGSLFVCLHPFRDAPRAQGRSVRLESPSSHFQNRARSPCAWRAKRPRTSRA